MEWMNRGQGQGQPVGPAANHTTAPAAAAPSPKKQMGGLANLGLMRFVQIALLFSVTVVLVAVVWFLALGDDGNTEGDYVDSSKLQAVFLNGGQVYFGDINNLNGKYLSMNNIYYLRVNQQVQPNQSTNTGNNDVSLVKLGCELHGPEDNMVINREQVIFWENLKDDGQVAKAVKEYKEQNPNGQKCDAAAANQTGTDTTTTPTTNQNTTDTTTTPNSTGR